MCPCLPGPSLPVSQTGTLALLASQGRYTTPPLVAKGGNRTKLPPVATPSRQQGWVEAGDWSAQAPACQSFLLCQGWCLERSHFTATRTGQSWAWSGIAPVLVPSPRESQVGPARCLWLRVPRESGLVGWEAASPPNSPGLQGFLAWPGGATSPEQKAELLWALRSHGSCQVRRRSSTPLVYIWIQLFLILLQLHTTPV